MVDPAPFLSTIAGTSAAMVAIVGGLLVARFVSIASDQEGAQQLLNDAQGRLTTTRRRAQEASEKLHDWFLNDFFVVKVIRAIGDGVQDIAALRKIGGYTSLADDELAEAVQTILDEFTLARHTLSDLLPANPEADDYPDWEDFKRAAPALPATSREEAWEAAYEDLVRPSQQDLPSSFGSSRFASPFIPLIPTPPEYIALRIQQRDALQATAERAKQQVEDIEEEVARLQGARDAIVRPKGLGWGLVVLGFFTFVGIVVPIWLLSRAPKHLTTRMGEVVFWLFLAGLLALLGYMSVLALRLSGWRRNAADNHVDAG